MRDFEFAKATKGMTAEDVLNYYRNLYHAEPQSTERGIIANALNDILPRMIVPPCKEGDTVYRVCKKKYDIDGYGMQWEEDWGIVTNNFNLGMLHEIGKTIFLTPEEAERVLKEKGE